MPTLQRTAAVLIFSAIACLGAACEQRDTPAEPPPLSASHGGSHSGTYTVWSLNEQIPGSEFPLETLADLSNLSGHLASGPVMITALASEKGLSGNLYWNPVTSAFAYYGVATGFQFAIDLDRRAIPSTGLHGSFGGGNVWATVLGNETHSPYVQFRRDLVNNPTGGKMRRYNVGAFSATGIRVSLISGKVYFGNFDPGQLIELDPETNEVRKWNTGNSPHFLELDALGRVYATAVAGGGFPDQIIRLEPNLAVGGANAITRWDIPDGGLQSTISLGTPNYIVEDLEGSLWFSETESNEYGRLNPVANEFQEFSKPGIDTPHGIGTSGLGPTLQMYGQEAGGNATDVLTNAVATLTSVIAMVVPTTSTVTPTTRTASFEDFVAPRTAVSITPARFTSMSSNGSGIDRFPQPPGVTMPTSATGVVLPNTIFGSVAGSDDVEMFVSTAIVAEPPRPVCPPDDDDDNDGLNNSNESVLNTLVGIADSDGDGIVDGNDDANGNGKDDEDEDDDDGCPDRDSDGDGEDDEDEDDDDGVVPPV